MSEVHESEYVIVGRGVGVGEYRVIGSRSFSFAPGRTDDDFFSFARNNVRFPGFFPSVLAWCGRMAVEWERFSRRTSPARASYRGMTDVRA